MALLVPASAKSPSSTHNSVAFISLTNSFLYLLLITASFCLCKLLRTERSLLIEMRSLMCNYNRISNNIISKAITHHNSYASTETEASASTMHSSHRDLRAIVVVVVLLRYLFDFFHKRKTYQEYSYTSCVISHAKQQKKVGLQSMS